MLETFEDAYAVREMFFAKGSQTPALNFWVTVANLDASASRFILQIDGHNLEATHKGGSKSSVVWPGQVSGEAVATFESKFVPDQAPRFIGEWAWFRMVDANRGAIAGFATAGRALNPERIPQGSGHRRTVERAQQSICSSSLARVQLRILIA